jgi:phosphohistidine phosphatase
VNARSGKEEARMQLYLIRHAHALDGDDDEARPLSGKGRAQVRRVASFLRASGVFAPEEIWHSPLVRARQTAELLGRRETPDVPRRAVAGLRSEDDPRRMVRRLARERRDLALVGHDPHLSTLASLLVAGAAMPPVFALKKCSVLALERVAGRWVVRWHVSPELLA